MTRRTDRPTPLGDLRELAAHAHAQRDLALALEVCRRVLVQGGGPDVPPLPHELEDDDHV